MDKLIVLLLIVFIIFIIYNTKENTQEKFTNDMGIYQRAANLGIRYLDKMVYFKDKSGVMFDIDDTLLFVNGDKLSPITPMIDLLNYCITKDLLIIIITARSNEYRTETIKHLNKYGIDYSYLYLRKSPQDDNDPNFKSKVKQKLLNDHKIKIIMSVGDQMVDIVGDYSGYCLKLPSRISGDNRLFEKLPDSDKIREII